MRTPGLRLDDSPPLSIPLSFIMTAPVAIAAAGGVLIVSGAEALVSRWSPITVSLTHLGTLGTLTMVMLGALYQLMAVVVGSPVPWPRLAHVVHALFVIGVVALCLGTATHSSAALWLAISTLAPALLLFLVPVGTALARARSINETSFGIGAACTCLLVTAASGTYMALNLARMSFSGPREVWIQLHLGVALLGWVGGLIMAVSWQVIPMFYLARESLPVRFKWGIQILGFVGALLPFFVLGIPRSGALGAAPQAALATASVALTPAILAVWVLHPAATAWGLRGRRRKRVDGSLLFWKAGLSLAPFCALAAIAAFTFESPKWSLLLGWLAIWGWAAMIIHGMLSRIVPFLVWLHRFAPMIGKVPVPSVKKLLPDRWTRIGFWLHLATVVLGVAAIFSASDLLCRATGIGLLATAIWMARWLIHLARQRPEPILDSRA